jgi:DNA polymerase elongation subunit (family B)
MAVIINKVLNFSEFKNGQEVTKDEIESEINRLKLLHTNTKNKNLSLKIILNSVYGVIGFKNFIAYNRDVAQSVTRQSEDLIKYTIKIFNDFFRNDWHTLTDVHEKMGITKVGEYDMDVINYADTDSVFLLLDSVMKTTDFKGSITEFALSLDKFALSNYVKIKLDEYVASFNGFLKKKNGADSLVLHMEQVNDSVLWVAKKMYIKNPVWDEGKILKPLEDIQIKGLEINKPSIPKHVRTKLRELVVYILEKKSDLQIDQLLDKIARIKDEFQTIDILEICKTTRCNDMEKWILDDTNTLEFIEKTPYHIKAAGYYNHLLHINKFGKKYDRIKSTEKVQFYCMNGGTGYFAFPSNVFPAEFAPPMHMELQFEKIFLDPFNNILEALGVPPLNPELLLFESIW